MNRLSLRFLGAPRVVSTEGRALGFPTARSLALLAYVAMQPDMTCPRSVAAAVFWPDRAEEEARAALRRTLYELRGALKGQPDILIVSRDRLALDAGVMECDAVRLLELAAAGAGDDIAAFLTPNPAVFLSGLEIGADMFEEWVLSQRRILDEAHRDLAVGFGRERLRQGDFEAALSAGESALARNDLDEDACRIVIRALAGLSRRGEALRRYADLAAALDRDLGAAPEPETEALAEHVRRGQLQLPRERLARPSAPSIAVLPFRDLTGSADQGYLVEAFTETITTELSRDRTLFVIASETASVYRRRLIEASEIANELGIRYLLDGRLQLDDARIRVEVKLTDGLRDVIVWTERYDRDRGDLLRVQDDIAAQVVATLRGYKGVIQRSQLKLSRATREPDLDAYDHLMRGMALKERFLRSDMRKARACFQRAIAIDPDMAMAHGWLAWTWFFEVYMGWTDQTQDALKNTFDAANAAVRLDPDLDFAHWALGAAHLAAGDCGRALDGFDRALRLNPNNSDALANRAWPLMFTRRSDEALADLSRAMRLNPFFPDWYLWGVGMAEFARGDSRAAATALRRIIVPNDQSEAFLVAALSETGQVDAARAAAGRLHEIDPAFTMVRFLGGLHFEDPTVAKRLRTALGAAGVDS